MPFDVLTTVDATTDAPGAIVLAAPELAARWPKPLPLPNIDPANAVVVSATVMYSTDCDPALRSASLQGGALVLHIHVADNCKLDLRTRTLFVLVGVAASRIERASVSYDNPALQALVSTTT